MTQQDLAARGTAIDSPTVRTLAAGQAAQQAMSAAASADAYTAAAPALSDAFSIVLAQFLTSYPHLAHAIRAHQDRLTGT